jgi:hypothetical protein
VVPFVGHFPSHNKRVCTNVSVSQPSTTAFASAAVLSVETTGGSGNTATGSFCAAGTEDGDGGGGGDDDCCVALASDLLSDSGTFDDTSTPGNKVSRGGMTEW